MILISNDQLAVVSGGYNSKSAYIDVEFDAVPLNQLEAVSLIFKNYNNNKGDANQLLVDINNSGIDPSVFVVNAEFSFYISS